MTVKIKSLLHKTVLMKLLIKLAYKCKTLCSKLTYFGLLLFSLFYGKNHNVRGISMASLLLELLKPCLALSHLHVNVLRLR